MEEGFLPIKSFEDLNCWREAGKLWRSLSDLLDRADLTRPSRRELAGRMLRCSAALMEEIAAAFSPWDTARFRKGLAAALADGRRLLALLKAGGENGLLSREALGDLLIALENFNRSVREHLRYLANVEIREKYREADRF